MDRYVTLMVGLAPLSALLLARAASRRDWTAWQHPRHSDWMPFADSPMAWAFVGFVLSPVAWAIYLLDRPHAPLREQPVGAVAAARDDA
jgi:hypothetical protein